MSELLPEAASGLEKKLARGFITEAPAGDFIQTLWDPYNCPKAVLPFLGWAFSLNRWSSNWDEATQRQIVANASQVHAEKGTRKSVERVLLDLGLQAKIVEWFEFDPPKTPGTFEIEVQQVLGPETPNIDQESEIQAFIDYAKPMSRRLAKISIHSSIQSTLYSAAGVRVFRTIRV